VRIWQKIVDENLPYALVLEDDANIEYSQQTVDRLQEMLTELNKLPKWDIVYLGNTTFYPPYQPRCPFKSKHSEHLFEVSTWEGTYTYFISNACARAFVKNAFPVRGAIDIYMSEQFTQQNLTALSMVPALNFTMNYPSDTTRNIE
jgi:GR25 family glycosyltransferase involved in LPS biosynthesis